MKQIIYFDNASTTKVDEEVLKTYNEVINGYMGNASSIHSLGVASSRLIQKSKENILHLLNMPNHEVIFTSGATESNNLALKGIALNYKNRGKHIIVSSVEHPSILESAHQLEEMGFVVTYLPVNKEGKVELNTLKEALRDETILVSIMAVNNEVGSINNIEEIASLLKQYPKIYFHVDAVQAIGKIDINYQDVDLLTFTSHKIHGVIGTGCLIKRKGISLYPVLSGGGQENNERSGTYNVPGIVSLAKALRFSLERQKASFNHVKELVKPLYDYFLNNSDEYEINSSLDNPFVVNVSLKKKKAAVIVEGLSQRGIMISSISACHSKGEKVSYVLKEMKHDEVLAHNTLRISLSNENTLDEVNTLLKNLDELVKGVRG